MAHYPNPDLAIEVDISRPQADRQAIYAALGVTELWIFDGEELSIKRLGDPPKADRYHAVEASGFLPVGPEDVEHWLLHEDSQRPGRLEPAHPLLGQEDTQEEGEKLRHTASPRYRPVQLLV